MRRDSFLLPVLSLGLLYCSMAFTAIVVNMSGSGRPGTLLHFALVFAMAAGMVWAGRRWRLRGFLAGLSVLLGLVCLAMPQLPDALFLSIALRGKPPLLSICASLLFPVALALFFRAIPAGRESFFYGLVMALGEILWAVLFPLLTSSSAGTPDNRLLYLFALSCLAMGGMGLLLGLTLWLRPAVSQAPARGSVGEKRVPLLWLFVAGAAFFALVGLETGMGQPKLALSPQFISLAHVLSLFLLPLTGYVLDSRKPERLAVIFIWPLMAAVLLMPVFVAVHLRGDLGLVALFCLSLVIRQILLLVVFSTVGRLLKTHAWLPLLLALAHCLHLAQLGGVATRGLVADLPLGLFTAACLFAALTLFCLWRFRLVLQRRPELWELPQEETDPQKNLAFATSYGLTGREQDILLGLLRGMTLEDMEQELGVTMRTVRYHITGLLKKTGKPSRQKLLLYYNTWKPQL
ncbi:hypothetical protein FACS1894168_2780 [Deltaproteobacteria bacterium]|nr:hypothetical protein FACS1894168_2780 [Deltaproteobacteria bacterium]